MLKVVIDTNIFIDALFNGDKEIAKIFDYEKNREIEFIVCDQTVSELYTIIKRICKRLKYTKDDILYVECEIGKILSRSKNIIIGNNFPRYCEDYQDDKFIECGKIGHADYVISSDKHISLIPACTRNLYKLNFKIMDILDFLSQYNAIILKDKIKKSNKFNKIRIRNNR